MNHIVKKFNPSRMISILLLLFSFLFVIWWGAPTISKGTDNINLIMHFDPDEGTTVAFYERFYKSAFICPPTTVAYPTGFYYVAGVFLFPYSCLNLARDNHRVIAITIRLFNLISILLTIAMIYSLALYLTRSRLLASLAPLFMITITDYLWWGISYRPHPFENLILLASLYFALIWIEKKGSRDMFLCIILAAYAFGIKYGGMFIFPAIQLALIIYFIKLEKAKLLEFVAKFSQLNYFLAVILIAAIFGIILCIHLVFIPSAVKITKLGASLGVKGLLSLKLVKMGITGLWIALFLCAVWIFINFYSRKISRRRLDKNTDVKLMSWENIALICNAAFMCLSGISIIYAAVFVLTNPYLVFHPMQFIRSFFSLGLIEFTFSHQGKGFFKEVLTNLNWFKMLFDKNVLGISGGIGLVWYFVIEFYNLKTQWQNYRTRLLQRGFIWMVILTHLCFLVLFIKFRAHHYLPLSDYLLCLLIIYGVSTSFKLAKEKWKKVIVSLLFLIILLGGFAERLPIALKLRRYRMDAYSDTGLEIGKWLEGRYDKEAKIWKDTNEFYVPPKFENVFFKYGVEDISQKLPQINRIDPDILIITNSCDPFFYNTRIIRTAINDGTLKGYQLIKAFKYSGPLILAGSSGKYKEVSIFSKTYHKKPGSQ